MSDGRIYLNGINALTGEYLVPPMTPAEAAAQARGTPPPAEQVGWLRRLLNKIGGQVFGLPQGLDPTDPAEVGWAVVFTPDTPEAVRKGLQPLLELRQKQVVKDPKEPEPLFKVFEYKPGETREGWLGKYGAHGADV